MLGSVALLTVGSTAAYFGPRVLKQKLEEHSVLLAVPISIALVSSPNDAREMNDLVSNVSILTKGLHDYYWLTFFVVGVVNIATSLVYWQHAFLIAGAFSFALEKGKDILKSNKV